MGSIEVYVRFIRSIDKILSLCTAKPPILQPHMHTKNAQNALLDTPTSPSFSHVQ